jgi:hypothetical protein
MACRKLALARPSSIRPRAAGPLLLNQLWMLLNKPDASNSLATFSKPLTSAWHVDAA